MWLLGDVLLHSLLCHMAPERTHGGLLTQCADVSTHIAVAGCSQLLDILLCQAMLKPQELDPVTQAI